MLALLGGLAERPAAQAPPLVARGSRVRVHLLTESGAFDRRVEGTIERVSRDTLRLRPKTGGPSQVFTVESGARLFVLTGHRSSLGRGAAIGGLLGVVAGGLVGVLAGKVCPGQEVLCINRRQIAITGGLVLAATGAATGLVIGALNPRDIWTPTGMFPAPRPDQARGTLGWSVGWSIAF
jgi:hypothetical protein